MEETSSENLFYRSSFFTLGETSGQTVVKLLSP